jgi:hypothetical protein
MVYAALAGRAQICRVRTYAQKNLVAGEALPKCSSLGSGCGRHCFRNNPCNPPRRWFTIRTGKRSSNHITVSHLCALEDMIVAVDQSRMID